MQTLQHPLRLPTVSVAGPLARLTDRLLARPLAAVLAAWHRRRVERATVRTLRGLDDCTLRDLGFHRSEIGGLAAELSGRAEITTLRGELAHRQRA
jgi:uncharacterized protein YjiS (DUF1127 family)